MVICLLPHAALKARCFLGSSTEMPRPAQYRKGSWWCKEARNCRDILPAAVGLWAPDHVPGEHRQGAEAATKVMEYWQAIRQHLVLDQFYRCHLQPCAWLAALDLILHLSQKCCEWPSNIKINHLLAKIRGIGHCCTRGRPLWMSTIPQQHWVLTWLSSLFICWETVWYSFVLLITTEFENLFTCLLVNWPLHSTSPRLECTPLFLVGNEAGGVPGWLSH